MGQTDWWNLRSREPRRWSVLHFWLGRLGPCMNCLLWFRVLLVIFALGIFQKKTRAHTAIRVCLCVCVSPFLWLRSKGSGVMENGRGVLGPWIRFSRFLRNRCLNYASSANSLLWFKYTLVFVATCRACAELCVTLWGYSSRITPFYPSCSEFYSLVPCNHAFSPCNQLPSLPLSLCLLISPPAPLRPWGAFVLLS